MDDNTLHREFYSHINQQALNPVFLVFALFMGFLLLKLPRRYAIFPMIAAAIYIPAAQHLVLMGLNFNMLRVLIVFGLIRILFRREKKLTSLNTIDKTIVWYVMIGVITGTLLQQTFGGFVNRIGFAFDAIGMYFLARYFIRDFDDIDRIIKMVAIMVFPIAITMIFEQATGRNLFGVLGGVPELAQLRRGHPRSQGTFAHAILAGSFGASLLPLMWGLWWRNERYKAAAILGAINATIITITSFSSGPIVTYLSGLLGLGLWIIRRQMRAITWGVFFILIMLHIIMKAPVWALIHRISIVEGSTSYHRFLLIDEAIKRFSEWYLVGSLSMAEWGMGLQDVTSQYIRIGVNGGLLTLILFIAVIILCFQTVGRAVRKTGEEPALGKLIWAIGVSLFTHTISFMGVSYFDQQINMFWYLTLAIISMIRDTIVTKS